MEENGQDMGASFGTGAGAWVVLRRWGLDIRKIDKVTPKLFRLGDGSARYPTQIAHNDRSIVCFAPDAKTAERYRDSVREIDGEYNRRRRAADGDRNAIVAAAEEARQNAIAKLLSERFKSQEQQG